MDSLFIGVTAHTAWTFLIASVVLVLLACVPYFKNRSNLAGFPLFSTHLSDEKQENYFFTSARIFYTDGYKKFKDTIYRLTSWEEGNVLIVPHSMLSELRKLPDDVLSIREATSQTLESNYTGLDADLSALTHSIKADLTPALTRLSAELFEEMEIAMDSFIPPCENPTGVQIYNSLAFVIAQVSGRLFVGKDLCRNPAYLECAVKYTLDVVNAAMAVKKVRPLLRRLLAPRLPEVKSLRDRERAAMDIIGPEIRRRKDAEEADVQWKRPDDMTQWLIARSGESLAKLTNLQLVLTFAAIDTTTATATNVVYTLAAMPECVPELREEICNVLADHGGLVTNKALQQMLKLDSYIREVTRFHPLGYTTFIRRVMKPFTLSNGQRIPTGVTIKALSFAVDADLQPQNEFSKFDGLRHYKQRVNAHVAGDQARAQLVSTNEENMAFGYGRHACPGRFFAANEIKMILVKLLSNYDISLPDGISERHAQIPAGNFSYPDPSKKVVLKRLSVQAP